MKLFETVKTESWQTRMMRWGYNLWPCIFCTGSRVTFIAADYKELHVSLGLNLRTRNRVGTVFGGSIYSSVDPYFMLMLMHILGKDYIVWDKAASVKFVKPIIHQVKCRFLITDELVEEIKHHLKLHGEYTFQLPLKYEDDAGKVYATFTKTIYTATKGHYRNKLEAKRNKA